MPLVSTLNLFIPHLRMYWNSVNPKRLQKITFCHTKSYLNFDHYYVVREVDTGGQCWGEVAKDVYKKIYSGFSLPGYPSLLKSLVANWSPSMVELKGEVSVFYNACMQTLWKHWSTHVGSALSLYPVPDSEHELTENPKTCFFLSTYFS